MMTKQSGFTLIELMVTVTIMTILAGIAIPSYRQFVVKNAESQSQARMKQLEIELNQWRSRALSYKGFRPKKFDSTGVVSYQYDEADNKTIYVPTNSTADNYQYKITLVGVASPTTTISLVPVASDAITADTLAVGRNWAMIAEPNTTKLLSAKKILLNSSGVQCKTRNNDSSVTITSNDCGSYAEKW